MEIESAELSEGIRMHSLSSPIVGVGKSPFPRDAVDVFGAHRILERRAGHRVDVHVGGEEVDVGVGVARLVVAACGARHMQAARPSKTRRGNRCYVVSSAFGSCIEAAEALHFLFVCHIWPERRCGSPFGRSCPER